MEFAEPGGSFDTGKRGSTDVSSNLAAQVTLIVITDDIYYNFINVMAEKQL